MSRQAHILLIDNFDSFTYNIWDYLSRCRATVEVRRRNEVSTSEISEFDGVVISPGPGNPAELPDLMNLVEFSVNHKPTLGICLGFQAIAYFYGSTILKGKPMHGKLSNIQIASHGNLLKGLPDQIQVVRYHSLIITNLKEPLKSLATTFDQELMAFEHQILPVAGLQYHPEAHLSQYGQAVFKNWLDLC